MKVKSLTKRKIQKLLYEAYLGNAPNKARDAVAEQIWNLVLEDYIEKLEEERK